MEDLRANDFNLAFHFVRDVPEIVIPPKPRDDSDEMGKWNEFF